MENLVVIPARSGSKRLKNKNLADLNKKPLIYYTINQCRKLSKIAHVYVSTDSQKIINYCRGFSFIKIKKRAKRLSTDKSNVNQSVLDVVSFLEKKKLKFKNVILLQPTSPLRKERDIFKSIDFFKKKNLQSLCTISNLREKHSELVIKKKRGIWKSLSKKIECNYIDGSIYMSKLDFLKKNKSLFKKDKTFLFKPNNSYNIDVDYNYDLTLAKELIKKINEKN